MADATVGALKVSLGLDSAQFETGMKKAQGSLGGFSKFAAGAGAAAGVALVAAATAMGVAVKRVVDNVDELSKAAQKVGVAVDELSRLKYAAELSDVSLEGLTTGLRKLSVNMMAMAGGSAGPAAEALRALGISVTDAGGQLRDGSEVFKDIAGKFGDMQDGAGKTALAMAIFGKSGADLIPMLNSGSEGLREMMAEADALGIVIDQKTGAAAEAFNDNLTRLSKVQEGITTQIAAAMLPAMESISGAMVGAAKNTASMDAIGKVLGGTIKVLATAAAAAGGLFVALGVEIGTAASAMRAIAVGDFAGAMKAIGAGWTQGRAVAESTAQVIRDIWAKPSGDIAAKAPQISDQIAAPIVQAGNKIKAAGEAAAKEAERARERLLADAERVIDSLMSDDQRYEKSFRERTAALDAARNADLISVAKYNDALEALNQEREARENKLAKPELFSDAGMKSSEDHMKELADAFEEAGRRMEEVFDDVRYSLEDTLHSLKSGDWVGALRSIGVAVKNVQAAFSSAGTTGDRVAAVAGVGQMVGQAIGGTAGSTISGIAGGAMAGFTLGGPIGAGIGAIVGGIAGLFSGNKAKKQAKAQAAEAERQRLAQIANAKAQLEIALLAASGDAVGALAAQRKLELASMDASLQGLQEQLWAAQDAAQRQAQQRGLDIRLMQVTGDAAGALAAQREDELKALDAGLRATQMAIYAAEDLAAAQEKQAAQAQVLAEAESTARDVLQGAYDRARDGLTAFIDRFKTLAVSLASYAKRLAGGLGGGSDLAMAQKEFTRVSALAAVRNEEGLSNLQAASEDYVSLLEDQATDATAYRRSMAAVQASVADAATYASTQVDVGEQQLAALDASVAGLLAINDNVISVRDAIIELGRAMTAAGSVNGASYVSANPDIAAAYQRYLQDQTGFDPFYRAGMSESEFGALHYQRTGQFEGRPGFTAAPSLASLTPATAQMVAADKIPVNENGMTGSVDPAIMAIALNTSSTANQLNVLNQLLQQLTDGGVAMPTVAAA